MLVISILLIIFDLASPVGGMWSVSPASWDAVKSEIEKKIGTS
jgi:hypothetical protein